MEAAARPQKLKVGDHQTVRASVLFDEAHPERPAEAALLLEALRRHGHLFVDSSSHVPPAMLRQTYDMLRRAHALPPEQREAFSHRGDQGADMKTTDFYAVDPEASGPRSRLYCAYQYPRPRFCLSSLLHGGRLLHADSAREEAYEPGTEATAEAWSFSRSRDASAEAGISPAGLPGLDTFMDDLYSQQDSLALGLLGAIAEALGLPAHAFTQHLNTGDLGTIRLMKYPPPPPDSDSVGISAHTDFVRHFAASCHSSVLQHPVLRPVCVSRAGADHLDESGRRGATVHVPTTRRLSTRGRVGRRPVSGRADCRHSQRHDGALHKRCVHVCVPCVSYVSYTI